MEIEDVSNQMRSMQAFQDAYQVVAKRLISPDFKNLDTELFMQYTTILEALKIALIVTRKGDAK
jgi:hypothetical protein